MKGLFFQVLVLVSNATIAQPIVFRASDVPVNSSFRAMSMPDDQVAWIAGSRGWIGRSLDGGTQWKFFRIGNDSTADYRTLYAQDSLRAIVANTGSPALIHRTTDGGRTWSVVYRNDHPDAFLDGAGFWDDQNGIIYGDPIGGHLMLIGTQDGGNTWVPYPETSRPAVITGEASFAASQTTLRCSGKSDVWIATGGVRASLFHSTDRGLTWDRSDTPMASGKPGAGIFSICLVGRKRIALAGGDYQSPRETTGVYCYQDSPGSAWKTTATGPGGYRSIIEISRDGLMIASGPGGTDVSTDRGEHWKGVSGAPNINVIGKSRKGNRLIAAGKNGIWIIMRSIGK